MIVINLIGYIFNCEYISVFAGMAQADKFEVRSRLLMEAMNYVGVNSPEEAAAVWAKGLRMRSAAMQYSVMSRKLKEIYESQLERSAPNWVTGMSSPWVDSYSIVKQEQINNDSYIVELLFSLATSTGLAGNYRAILNVDREDGFWRISKISMDTELFPYTGFTASRKRV